jgi:hypothetical protein
MHAYRLRNGLASETFVTEDGKTYGIAGADGKWQTELSATEKEQVRANVAAMRRLEPAAIHSVPVRPAK